MPLSIEFVPEERETIAALRLAGRATFREAPELREAVFAAVEAARDKNLVVELERVERFDTAAMAVLVEALMATRDSETSIFLLHASESVRGVFRLAGLEEALTCCVDCWEEVGAAVAS